MHKSARFGLVKSGLDAHTLGINHIAQLIEECGFEVHVAKSEIAQAVDKISAKTNFSVFKNWILGHNITHIGFSYRLDPQQALEAFVRLVHQIEDDVQISPKKGGLIKKMYFAGLPESCDLVENEFGTRYMTFRGDETPKESLLKLGLPDHLIPQSIQEQSVYDELRLNFGKSIIRQEKQFHICPTKEFDYPEYGTSKDHLIKRLTAAKSADQLPLTRVHAGPYMKDREKALALFSDWLKKLAGSHFLDIVSVGSSQLSQSHFGEDWDDLPNGGGVPFNSVLELRAIQEDAIPMLVRAYSATNNIPHVAHLLEQNLNMAWHALSFWWFNQLDGRGPLGLRQSISEHIEALKYIARVGKPFEPNTPHHFAFRGSDDLTYIVSAFLAAKIAKKHGIRYFVLQNMLNTPKSTWGLRDLAKSRALLQLIRGLEDRNFRVIYQPRAGLDYFSTDIEKAKIQLAAVSALMTDVEPKNMDSPDIVHVVSYSEALFLANPGVINESIQITKAALEFYPEFRHKNALEDITQSKDLMDQTEKLAVEAHMLVQDMEKNIKNLYSVEGLHILFQMGYLPVPFLWECREEYANAVNWTTRILGGGVHVVDEKGKRISIQDRLRRIKEINPKIY
ncbi:MAG: cobalamin-binding protein [Candidatus Aminicenantes bacterium]|nr:MAG: cobalamin-binding protein [Candidatus Aminicenantes bacterium]